MNTYELVIILNPDLSADLQKKLIGKYEKQITDSKGKVAGKEDWGKKKLAYEISKLDEGFYFLLKINLDPSEALKLQTLLKNDDKVLRHMLIKVE